jgi:putative ABC transport system substrate-binding protein
VASPGAFEHLLAGFRHGLNDAGIFEGQNVTIEYRWAESRYERLPALADELVRAVYPCLWRSEEKTPL